MDTIGTLLRKRTPKEPEVSSVISYPTYVGLELEVSNAGRLDFFYDPDDEELLWRTSMDYSIRGDNPMEIRFSKPLSPRQVEIAFEQLLNVDTLEVNDSCGVHVHVDVRDLTIEQLGRVISLYLILERTLYRYCGVSRLDNNFCVPLHKALGGFSVQWATNRFAFGEELRYGGLNLHAIRKFGSLEFRMHPGTTDLMRILDWMNICAAVKMHGKEFLGPKDAYRNIVGNPELFMTAIFGERLSHSLMYDGLIYDLEQGLIDSKNLVTWDEAQAAAYRIRTRRSKKNGPTLWDMWNEKRNNHHIPVDGLMNVNVDDIHGPDFLGA